MKFIPRLALAASLSAAVPAATLAQQTQVFTNTERYYQEGLELFDRAKYGAAQQAFRRYLAATERRSGTQLTQDRGADAEYYDAVAGLYLLHPDAEGQMLAFAAHNPAHPRAASAFLELGKFYFAKKDYPKAVEYLQRVEADNLALEQRGEAEFKLAYSYFAQKEFDKAKLLFDRSKQGNHQYRYASSYYAGYLAYQAGDYAAARQDLGVAEQSDAYRPVVPAVMSQIYYKEGDYDGLIRYGSAALNQTPPPQSADEIQLLVADAYYQKQDFKQAAPYFTQYANGRKRVEPALQYKIGYANYQLGDYKNAANSFKTVAARKDSLGQNAAYHLGLSYLKLNQKQPALNAFDAARKATFDQQITENATVKYAQINYELGNSQEVTTVLQDFDKQYPRSKNADVVDDLLSTSFLNSSDYAKAIAYLEKLNSLSPKLKATYQRVTYLQAATLYNNSQFTEALALLDKSLKYPQDEALRAQAQVLQGEIYSVGQRYPEAITAYAAAARTTRSGGGADNDIEQQARYGLGYAYYNTKDYARAKPQFTAWIGDKSARPANPNYYDVTLRLGDIAYVDKTYPQALSYYDKVIQANAADKDYAYYQKSVVLGLMGKRDEAAGTLSTLLKTNPNSRYAEQAVYQQAELDFQGANFQAAVDGFSRLLRARPNSPLAPQALQKRGVAYANLEQHDKAVADFEQVLNQYPGTQAANSALYSLQESLTALGRTEEFDKYLAQFKQQNPQSNAAVSVEFEAAKSLYLAEKYAQAIPRLESYLKQYPSNALAADGRYYLADSYLQTGKSAEALPRLKAVVEENKSEYVNRAVSRVADLEYANKNYPEAIKYFQRLRESSTNKREVANAGVGLMKSYYESGDYDNTRRVAQELIAQSGASLSAAGAAPLYLGKASYKAGNLDQAITELNKAATGTDENAAEAQYTVAQILFEQKKYDDALDAAYKTNGSAFETWQGRGFLLIADIYAAQGDTFQARATLNSIIDNNFPLAEIIEGAKKRLAALPAEGSSATPVKPASTPAPTTTKKPATRQSAPVRSNLTPTTAPPDSTATPQ
ncbi:tetratricopeptide repeat protein [Hymenobacter sp. BT507]|uniref:Tetratricopeptide repeat protein n=1 Tax=Hymenobacter citatus TaxID=2763506 RepID=A0ABR7MP93_9BACT|nr:tetratricopeptide repeat protein [Hymenobacter citatus]MBC6612901.1 tetratricopeptide repeat protein [Hymenobacter citatus]